jgi:hypothetical protein
MSKMPSDSQPINTALWPAFLERLFAAGVEIGKTKDGTPYLRRTVHGQVLYTHLPKNFDEKHLDKLGYVGCFVFDSTCRKLEIEKHKYFKGWYMVL